jgi:hypothetical protein
MTVKQRAETEDAEQEQRRVFFRTVPVFDRSQVIELETGTTTPLEPPSEPLTGDSHAHHLEPLQRFAQSLGYDVSFEPIAGPTGGWRDTKTKRIVVDADAPANAQLRILTHESIHALGVDYQQYTRSQAEVIVDTTTREAGG